MEHNDKLMVEVQETEKALKSAENLLQSALAKKSVYENQLKDTDEVLKTLGTTAEKGAEDIKAIDSEIESTLAKIKTLIPYDVLEKFGPKTQAQ